jgi:hypothetical protein
MAKNFGTQCSTWSKAVDDVERGIAREKLTAMYRSALSKRELIRCGLRNGIRPEYLSLRYDIPVEHILKAKAIWEREGERFKTGWVQETRGKREEQRDSDIKR